MPRDKSTASKNRSKKEAINRRFIAVDPMSRSHEQARSAYGSMA